MGNTGISSLTIQKGKPRVRLLCIDGGGIRGVIPLRILHEIEEKVGKPIHEIFDVIVGTSTGGFITTMLTFPMKGDKILAAKDITKLYQEHGREIFSESFLESVFDKLTSFSQSIHGATMDACGLFKAKYKNTGVQKLINDNFDPKLQLKDSKIPIGLMTCLKNTDQSLLLNSHLSQSGVQLHNMPLEQALLSTSAAPTYFPSVGVKNEKVQERSYFGSFDEIKFDEEEFVLEDGGTTCNNPVVYGVSYVQFIMNLNGIKDYDLETISIGTGLSTTPIVTKPNTGYIQFFKDMNSDPLGIERKAKDAYLKVKKVVYEDQEGAGTRYYRLQPSITQYQSDHMDDVSEKNIDSLIKSAEDYLNGEESGKKFAAMIEMLKDESKRMDPKLFHHADGKPFPVEYKGSNSPTKVVNMK